MLLQSWGSRKGPEPLMVDTGNAQAVADAVGSPPVGEPQVDDPAFPPCGQLVWAAAWLAGAIRQWLTCPVAVDPAVHGGRCDAEAFGDAALGPLMLDDQRHHPGPAGGGQWCVTVGHGRPPGSSS